MHKRILSILVSVFLFSSVTYAADFEFEKSFHLNYATLSLRDSADTVYIGDMNRSGLGIGAHVALLYPMGENLSIGPNINFCYSQINYGSWYHLDVYQPSLGPIVKWKMDGNSYELFLNYNLGLVVTEQEPEFADVAAGTGPSGAFVSNLRGFILGFRSKMYAASKDIVIGPYVTVSMPSLIAFEFRRLFQGSYQDAWVNIDITYLEAGVSLFF